MALDRIALNLSVKGVPIDYISEREWGLPLEEIYSRNMMRVFCPVLIDEKKLEYIKTILQPTGFSKVLGPLGEFLPDGDNYRDKSAILPITDLAKAVGIADLEAKVQSPVDTIDFVNGTELNLQQIFKPSYLFAPDGTAVKDLNTIASGSYTIGSGGDYATWASGIGDVASAMTGNLTFTQISAVTETAIGNWSTRNLAGFILTITSSINPKGNFAAGWVISSNHINNTFSFQAATAAGTINISNLNIKRILATLASRVELYFQNCISGTNLNVNDCVIDRNSLGTTPNFGIYVGDADYVIKMYNVVIANVLGATTSAGMVCTASHASSIYENITITGCLLGLMSGTTAHTRRNIACIGNTTDFSGSAGTFTKCASSDTTGSEAGLRSLTAANEFQSLDITSPSFLKLIRGRTLGNGGVAPSIAANTYGIRGNPRPRSGRYSIGADEVNAHHNGQENGLERALHRGLA